MLKDATTRAVGRRPDRDRRQARHLPLRRRRRGVVPARRPRDRRRPRRHRGLLPAVAARRRRSTATRPARPSTSSSPTARSPRSSSSARSPSPAEPRRGRPGVDPATGLDFEACLDVPGAVRTAITRLSPPSRDARGDVLDDPVAPLAEPGQQQLGVGLAARLELEVHLDLVERAGRRRCARGPPRSRWRRPRRPPTSSRARPPGRSGMRSVQVEVATGRRPCRAGSPCRAAAGRCCRRRAPPTVGRREAAAARRGSRRRRRRRPARPPSWRARGSPARRATGTPRRP